MAPGPEAHAADNHIGPFNEPEDRLQVIARDHPPLQALVDQVGHGDVGGRGYPDDIGPGAERTHRRDVGRPLVGPAPNHQHLAPGALVGSGCPCRDEGEVAGTGIDLRFEGDADIRHIRTLHLRPVERYYLRRPDAGGGDIDGDDRCPACVCPGDKGCKRFPHRPREPGADHRVDDDVGCGKERAEPIGLGGTPDPVKDNGAVPEEGFLSSGRRSHRVAVGADDVDRVEVLEVPRRHHPVAAVVPPPAEDENAGGPICKDGIGGRLPCALHHRKRRMAERNSVPLDRPHPAGVDHAGLQKFTHFVCRHVPSLRKGCMIGAMVLLS